MLRILTLAAIGAAAAIGARAQPSGPAPAGDHGPGMMMMLHEHLAKLDANGDGFISRDEFLSHPSAMFDRLDANHDGRLSKDELAAMAAMHHEHKVCKVQGAGDKEPRDVPCGSLEGMHGMAGHGAHMAMMMHHMAEALDTDHDGRISLAEAEAGARHHFEMLDRNHDGFITKDEMPAADVRIEKHVEMHE
jgi:Ca2+-binding EF-hand superfamily protein